MAGDLFGAIGDSINQDKGFIFGLANNAISYSQSKKSQRRAYDYARLLQQQQYDLSIRGYKEAPSAQRFGLETAGYNPMLALGNVGNGVSVAGGTPVNANSTDSANLAGNVAIMQGIKNQTEQTKASTDQLYAEADKAKAEKAEIVQRLPYVSEQAKANYMKTTMESAKLENDIHYQNEYLNYLSTSLSNAKEIEQIKAEAQKYGANMSYKGTVYNADTNAETMRGTRTDRLPFGFGSTYYDKRNLSYPNTNDRKYWREYYY